MWRAFSTGTSSCFASHDGKVRLREEQLAMTKLLEQIESAAELQTMTLPDLNQLSGEIRERLCGLLSARTAHFASNLGVVELCLALHSVFDFRRDRLIWDTGHQIYPHKLVTGRNRDFDSIRTRGGLM